MKTTPPRARFGRLGENARLVWALFVKDALEALRNKNTIMVIISSLLMVFFYRALPALGLAGESPNLLVYAAGDSALVPLLENSQSFNLYTYPSEEAMKRVLANGEVPELGLVIPAGFDQALQTGGNPELQGFVLRWVSAEDAAELERIAEAELARLLGQPVQINLEGNRVDLLPESGGVGMQAGFGLTYVLVMIGVILVPHLMLEEKQERTLEVLRVSPAAAWHIVTGKALAGLCYCCLGGAVALAVNAGLIVHWWLAILTVIVGSLFTLSFGLWLGIQVESRAQLALWSWVFLLPLLMPLVFSLLSGLIPEFWVGVFSYVPSAVIFDLARTSFAGPFPLAKTLLLIAWVMAAAGAVLAVVAWIVRRQDRETEALSVRLVSAVVRRGQPERENAQSRTAKLQQISLASSSRATPEARSGGAAHTAPARPGARNSLAIIWAIAAKDLVEAIKNRLVLSILVGSLFVVLSSAMLPVLLALNDTPGVVVYDQGRSTILRGLSAGDAFRLSIVDSQEELEQALSGSPNLRLGLILPADFDQQAGSGQEINLYASYPQWADPDQLAQRTAFFEQQLSQAAWSPVRLELAGHAVYPPVEMVGQSSVFSLNLLAVVLVIGIALVPLLMIEEKEAKTLPVLMVSPANLTHIIVGKALVGLFYSLLPALIALLFYQRLIVHWEAILLAILLTAALAVAAGLLLGLMADTPTNASMWGSLLLVLLIGSAFLSLFTGLDIPEAARSVLAWLPGTAMMQLVGIAQVREIPVDLLWLNASALLVAIAVACALLAWRLRRMES